MDTTLPVRAPAVAPVVAAATVLYYDVLCFQPENLELLRRRLSVVTLPTPAEETDAILAGIDVAFAPLGYYWGRERMERAPRLKIIASNTTGTQHIDVAAARALGIRVVSLEGESAFLQSITPTAELTWGLILAVTRRIPWAFESVRAGQWNRRPFRGPGMLSTLSLGVVGLGRLGTMVARYGVAFGMRVRGVDPAPVAAPDGVERVDSLERLVAESDVVTLHVPLTATTRGMVDAHLLARVKPGAYLINTSRGEIVDEAALRHALERGPLAGAALDVLAGEFAPDFGAGVTVHPLVAYARTHDNLLLTPHIGGSTVDAWRRTEAHTIQRVLEALAG